MSTTKLWVFIAFCHVPSHIGLWAQMHMGTHMHTHSHWPSSKEALTSQEVKGTDFLLHWFPETSSWELGRSRQNWLPLQRARRRTVKDRIQTEKLYHSRVRVKKEIFTDKPSGELSSRDSREEVGCRNNDGTRNVNSKEAGNLFMLFTKPEPTLLCFIAAYISSCELNQSLLNQSPMRVDTWVVFLIFCFYITNNASINNLYQQVCTYLAISVQYILGTWMDTSGE